MPDSLTKKGPPARPAGGVKRAQNRTTIAGKFEARSTKFETNSNFKSPKFKTLPPSVLKIRISNFEFRIYSTALPKKEQPANQKEKRHIAAGPRYRTAAPPSPLSSSTGTFIV